MGLLGKLVSRFVLRVNMLANSLQAFYGAKSLPIPID